jgi:hypothetical protein
VFLPLLAAAQSRYQVELVLSVASDDPVVTAALSTDGRVAYATKKSVQYGERWQRRAEVYVARLAGPAKEKKRIVRDNYFRDATDPRRPLPFAVERLAWSPDGSGLAVEMAPTGEATATFFFKSTGGEMKLGSGGNGVGGYGATWLAEGRSVGLLEEGVSPRLLHRVLVVRMEAGRAVGLFRPRTFAGVAWLSGKMQAVLAERDKDFAQPPRLLLGDLNSGAVTDLGSDPDYLGGLRATPDGERFSYFAGQKKLLLRKLTGEVAGEIVIPFAHYEWLGASDALIFLDPEKPGVPGGWLAVWDPATQASQRLLPDERIADFWVAPDGSHVAVLTTDEVSQLKIYNLTKY